MEKVDIEKIMEEIRSEIKAKGYTNDMLSFSDVVASNTEQKTMEDYYDILNRIWNVQAYKVFTPEIGISGKLKVFFKKVLRKFMKFYIEPIVADQNQFNANTVRLLNLVNSYMELNDRKIEMLETEIEQLKKQLNSKQG